ncbi:MAG: nucleotidyltransferase domain-containing protein [Armatimonadetes bacterium]|nr:nucleotidyltransferase domain-containing protein [Armatimonadota bacterium]
MAGKVAATKDRIASILEAVRRHVPIAAAYLFGSQARGEPSENSDIDIAVFSPAVEGMSVWDRMELEIAIRREVGYDAHIILYSDRWLGAADKRPASFVAHILKTGKRLV